MLAYGQSTLITKKLQKEKKKKNTMMEKRASSPSSMDIMGGGSRDEEDGSCNSTVTTMRTAETLLRLVPMTLCVAALVVMLKDSQTNDYGSISYSDLGAFRFSIPSYMYSYMYIVSFSYIQVC